MYMYKEMSIIYPYGIGVMHHEVMLSSYGV